MADAKETSWSKLALVAGIAFFLGRETVEQSPPAQTFAQPPAYPPPQITIAPTALQENYTSPAEVTYFRNCSEARAAGAAPVRTGDPGYAPHLDRDGDGAGCE